MMIPQSREELIKLVTFGILYCVVGKAFITHHLSFITTYVRFVQDISHPQFRIGLYAWNGKYIVKIEAGPYEQTYKVSEMDISDPDAVPTMLDDEFLMRVTQRFQQMDLDWQATGERNELF